MITFIGNLISSFTQLYRGIHSPFKSKKTVKYPSRKLVKHPICLFSIKCLSLKFAFMTLGQRIPSLLQVLLVSLSRQATVAPTLHFPQQLVVIVQS